MKKKNKQEINLRHFHLSLIKIFIFKIRIQKVNISACSFTRGAVVGEFV